MNIALHIGPDGGVTLHAGRSYRALVIVNGETTLQALGMTLLRSGFALEGFAASGPESWDGERPHDWPEEPPIAIAANECLVRVSGIFAGAAGASAIRFERDTPIGSSHALYTLAAVWECRGRPIAASTGASPAVPAPKDKGEQRQTMTVLVTAAALIGVGVWQHARSEKRFERETQRMRRMIADSDRERIDSRVERLMSDGLDRQAAEQLAIEEELSPELAALQAVEQSRDGASAAGEEL
jgi:hypothetical protein